MQIVSLDIDLLQNFRSYLNLLNFAFIFAALFCLKVGLFQLEDTVCRKPGWETQKFSNLNTLLPGIVVWIVIIQGV
jgi:hypothetical protein